MDHHQHHFTFRRPRIPWACTETSRRCFPSIKISQRYVTPLSSTTGYAVTTAPGPWRIGSSSNVPAAQPGQRMLALLVESLFALAPYVSRASASGEVRALSRGSDRGAE